MKRDVSISEKYGPAMVITDQQIADRYFEELVLHCMSFGKDRTEAEVIERTNLGYYAGYYDEATRARVEKLFACSHPFFGSIAEQGPVDPKQAFEMGRKLGEDILNKSLTDAVKNVVEEHK